MGLLDGTFVKLREKCTCPFLNKVCIENECMLWITYKRHDNIDFLGCAITFLPILLGENIIASNQAAASTDKVANEVNLGFNGLLSLARMTSFNAENIRRDKELPPTEEASRTLANRREG